MKRLLVVIPHRNGRDLLLRALAAVEVAVDSTCDDVLVVDNGSSDDSISAVRERHPRVEIFSSPWNLGFGRAVNLGMTRGTHRYVLVLNNDCVATRDVVDGLIATLDRDPHIGVVGPGLQGLDGRPARAWGRAPTPLGEIGIRPRRTPTSEGAEPRDVETLVGACMLVRREAVAAVGGFDEAFFFYFEETEWCLRLRRAGWRVVFVPAVSVLHGKGASVTTLRREAQIEMLRSRLLYYRRAFSGPTAAMLTAWRIARLVVNALVASVATVLTLGLVAGQRRRTMTYLTLVAFIAAGRPSSWGLPGKEPE